MNTKYVCLILLRNEKNSNFTYWVDFLLIMKRLNIDFCKTAAGNERCPKKTQELCEKRLPTYMSNFIFLPAHEITYLELLTCEKLCKNIYLCLIGSLGLYIRTLGICFQLLKVVFVPATLFLTFSTHCHLKRRVVNSRTRCN